MKALSFWDVLVCIFCGIILVRVLAHMYLKWLIDGIKETVAEMNDFYEINGRSPAEIEKSGKREELDQLANQGGGYYRKAVLVTTFLLWPAKVSTYGQRMVDAYDEVGSLAGLMGSYEVVSDITKGCIENRPQYESDHLIGLAASLDVVPPFWIII